VKEVETCLLTGFKAPLASIGSQYTKEISKLNAIVVEWWFVFSSLNSTED
jgi:hypothetical protein